MSLVARLLVLVFCGAFLALFSVFYVSGISGCSGPAAEETATSFPETCAEVQEAALDETGERPDDGTYTLYVDGDESMPWDAYCHDMSRAEPSEYLDVTEEDNYSQIGNGFTFAQTTYRRLRIDPILLEINPLDNTFATDDFAEYEPTFPIETMESIPAGWAEFVSSGESEETEEAAESRVSLAGTPFIFDESIEANGYFCSESQPEEIGDQFMEGTGFTVESDLTGFTLTAIHNMAVLGAYILEVADCQNLVSSDYTEVFWPLEYVGQ